MWPDQYIEWAQQTHPLLTRVVANALAQRYLESNPQLNVDTPEIIGDTIRHTFNLASARRIYRQYFTSLKEFRWWLMGIAFTYLRNRLIERPEYTERARSLQPQLLQSFGWVILDGMTISEVARQLGLSAAEVDRRVSAAIQSILE